MTLYRDGSSSETVNLCDECRGAISLDAFACGEDDTLAPVFPEVEEFTRNAGFDSDFGE